MAELSVADLAQHRATLTGHCYRMLGSAADADDAVQETMLRAFRALSQFEQRASLKTWLVRIATRVCLDALSDGSRRMRPMETGPAGSIEGPLTKLPASDWIDPIPDGSVLPSDADPAELTILRQSVRLAFVAALQHLPPKQRAVLLLSDVFDWPAAEIAGALETTVAAVNSALQRAREGVGERNLTFLREPSKAPADLLDRYVEAFERYDLDALLALMREDVILSMPPYSLWLTGHASVRGWLQGPGIHCRGSRLIRTSASGSPAFGQYRRNPTSGRFAAWSLIVLELEQGSISALNHFLDVGALFPRFGLELELEPSA